MIVEWLLGNTKREFYVTGSGLVSVPIAPAKEIPTVIVEHHKLEAERTMGIAHLHRVI